MCEELSVSIAKQTMSREHASHGLQEAACPSTASRAGRGRIEDFEKLSAILEKIARSKGIGPADIELWFADEALSLS
jgi:hypothetical protein